MTNTFWFWLVTYLKKKKNLLGIIYHNEAPLIIFLLNAMIYHYNNIHQNYYPAR